MGLLSRRAPSSGSPLAMPPFGGAMTSLPLGLPRGTPLAGFPRTPSPRSPTKGIAQGLRLRFAQLSAPKGLWPFSASIPSPGAAARSYLAALQRGDGISALWPWIGGLCFRVLENYSLS